MRTSATSMMIKLGKFKKRDGEKKNNFYKEKDGHRKIERSLKMESADQASMIYMRSIFYTRIIFNPPPMRNFSLLNFRICLQCTVS